MQAAAGQRQQLRCAAGLEVQYLFRTAGFCRIKFGVVDIAGDDIAVPERFQNRDSDQAQPAASEHRNRLACVQLAQFCDCGIGRYTRAGQHCRLRRVDAFNVDQITRVRHH